MWLLMSEQKDDWLGFFAMLFAFLIVLIFLPKIFGASFILFLILSYKMRKDREKKEKENQSVNK